MGCFFFMRLILLLTAIMTLVTADTTWSGLNLCDSKTCSVSPNLPYLNISLAYLAIPTVCTNLVGNNGQNAYLVDERRHTCYQATNGDGAYRFDFDVHRNKGSDVTNTLDWGSCVDAMNKMVDGEISCGGWPAKTIAGQRVQVGLFSCYASPQPGFCAGTEGYVV